jgi:hypothetical protein
MSVSFPSLEFFQSLKDQLSADPECSKAVDPSEAYCGFLIGDALYVVEFDGRECVAVVHGGNLLDLDFVLAAPKEIWSKAVAAIVDGGASGDSSLERLIDQGALEIRSEMDDGQELGRAALGFLQVFFDQARHLDVKFE